MKRRKLNWIVGATAGALTAAFIASAAWCVDRQDKADFEIDLRNSARVALSPFLARIVDEGTCDVKRDDILGQTSNYVGTGKFQVGSHFLHNYKGELSVYELKPIYIASKPKYESLSLSQPEQPPEVTVVLTLWGLDKKTNQRYFVFADPQEACRDRLLRKAPAAPLGR